MTYHFHSTNPEVHPMRYDPRTDKAVDLNEIAAECRAAVEARTEQVRLACIEQLERLLALELDNH